MACQNRASRQDFPHRLSFGLPPLAAAAGGVGGKAKIWIGGDRGLAIAGNSSMAASHPGEPSRQTPIVHREQCRAIQNISSLTPDSCGNFPKSLFSFTWHLSSIFCQCLIVSYSHLDETGLS